RARDQSVTRTITGWRFRLRRFSWRFEWQPRPTLYPHLARAAFLAIAVRFFADSFFPLAFAPFMPAWRRATVSGLSGVVGGSCGIFPTEISTISLASWFGSRGRLGRFAMPGVSHGQRGGRPSPPGSN